MKQKDLWVVYFYLTTHHHVLNQDYKTYHSRLYKIIHLMNAKPHLVTYKAPHQRTIQAPHQRIGS